MTTRLQTMTAQWAIGSHRYQVWERLKRPWFDKVDLFALIRTLFSCNVVRLMLKTAFLKQSSQASSLSASQTFYNNSTNLHFWIFKSCSECHISFSMLLSVALLAQCTDALQYKDRLCACRGGFYSSLSHHLVSVHGWHWLPTQSNSPSLTCWLRATLTELIECIWLQQLDLGLKQVAVHWSGGGINQY